MSFPRYPQYKDSGVDWLGQVPAHWEVKRLRFLAELNPSKSEVAALERGTLVSFIPMDSVGDDGSLKLETEKTLAEVETGYTYFRDGDVTIAKITPCYENGKGAVMRGLTNGIGFGTTELIVARPRSDALRSDYLHYLFISSEFRALGESQMYGAGGQKRVPDSFVRDFATAFPPLPEQREIAGFLDRETGKIDALVAEQERLLELLKEKRQAVIAHAVTRGLNPNAPLKPSGLDWLGDVPAHWEVRKLSHLFRAGKGKNGQMLTKEFCGANPGEYPVYSGQTEDDGVMGTWDQYEFDFGEKGVLFSTTVGAKAMNLRQLFGRFSLSQNCMVIWPSSALCETRFFYYHFQPLFAFEREMIPDHMQASFRMEDLYGYRIALPSLSEQRAIVAHLDAATAQFDALTAEVERALALLQERRTALISAAVTGQIDVRRELAT